MKNLARIVVNIPRATKAKFKKDVLNSGRTISFVLRELIESYEPERPQRRKKKRHVA